ncbi:DUF397 domain-containing protein [Kitasatospora sp. NPDC059463]|uniref:DUF397 domain-containing protein n=1 Tax=unclassified Kitasatospora TaxID=2633591 RepID=UPI0036751AAE
MTDWQKSSMSGNSNQCVEVRAAGDRIELRESDAPDAIVTTTRPTFALCIEAVKHGAFDHLIP